MGKLLKKIETISVIAPASHTPKSRFESALKNLKKFKLNAIYSKNIIKPDTFFASTYENQWKDLKSSLLNSENIIWALRGGYGSMRFIPELAKMKKPLKPKLLIGFSDITCLHIHLNQNWNWITLHANNFNNINQKLVKLIQGEIKELKYPIKPFNKQARLKKIKGKLIGGNLALVQSTIGTKAQLNSNGKILFLEDVGERGYCVDRMLEQLLQSKVITNKTRAIVFGQFTEAQEANGKDLVKKAFENFSKKVNIPIYWKLNSGHGKINNPLFFNLETQLDKTRLIQDLRGLI